MSDGTLTRSNLADSVHREVGVSRTEALQLIDDFFETISEALEKGQDVKIAGFGSFILRDKKERIGRNPKTGESALINARRVVLFKASQLMKKRVSDH